MEVLNVKTVIYTSECFQTEVSETEVSAESEVSYSKVSGTEVSKINLRFMYGLSMVFSGGVNNRFWRSV